MSTLTDADRARHWADVELADRRAEACRASVESHGDDEYWFGLHCQYCHSTRGLYWSAVRREAHCLECREIVPGTNPDAILYFEYVSRMQAQELGPRPLSWAAWKVERLKWKIERLK